MINLLRDGQGDYVIKTSLSQKFTINGRTKAYPVYRVRLDKLFYNDQNDRIATWISQYKSEHGAEAFSALDREEYVREHPDVVGASFFTKAAEG